MPKLTVDGKTVEVEAGKRLVNAIEAAGVNIGHRCGGNAHCTTCQVVFEAGEPEKITEAEKDLLADRDLTGKVRLSCQITCDQDMTVKSVMRLETEGWDSAGETPAADIQPDPVWV